LKIIYALNTGASKYIKPILIDLKGKTDNNSIIIGDLNIPVSTMDRLSSQKSISKNCP